jgi:hypothetical protein
MNIVPPEVTPSPAEALWQALGPTRRSMMASRIQEEALPQALAQRGSVNRRFTVPHSLSALLWVSSLAGVCAYAWVIAVAGVDPRSMPRTTIVVAAIIVAWIVRGELMRRYYRNSPRGRAEWEAFERRGFF